MTNQKLATAYAEQALSKGYNHSKSFYFNKNIAFSYGSHFVIAIINKGKQADFNTRKYSNTTARHKGLVERALIKQGYKINYKEL